MRNPNGYGGVTKLSGNRRRPYRARITDGWKWKDGRAVQVYRTLGYYATHEEALEALARYHREPLTDGTVTFKELYEMWSEEKFPTLASKNIYVSAFAASEPLHMLVFSGIRRADLQACIDNCGKSYNVMVRMKTLWNQLYRYARENDVTDRNYAEAVSIRKFKPKDPVSKHKRFTPEEVAVLWMKAEENRFVRLILMLIYSGLRIGELLELNPAAVHLGERWIEIRRSKTASGIRQVPIAAKTAPFWAEFAKEGGAGAGYMKIWDAFGETCEEIGISRHLPHDTRYTCISMLADAHVEKSIIKRIVGHKGNDVTDDVYTHFDVGTLIDAVDKI